MAKVKSLFPGWKDSEGNVYHAQDPRLVGMGNPPSDLTWANSHPGQGTIPMAQVLVSLDVYGKAVEHTEGE